MRTKTHRYANVHQNTTPHQPRRGQFHLHTVPSTIWIPNNLITASKDVGHNPYDVNIEHYCAPVVHPVTGKTITQYKKLSNNPLLKEIWTTGLGNEVGRMIQGNHKIGTKGTNFIFVMSHVEIPNSPRDRVVTYCRLVVDF